MVIPDPFLGGDFNANQPDQYNPSGPTIDSMENKPRKLVCRLSKIVRQFHLSLAMWMFCILSLDTKYTVRARLKSMPSYISPSYPVRFYSR